LAFVLIGGRRNASFCLPVYGLTSSGAVVAPETTRVKDRTPRNLEHCREKTTEQNAAKDSTKKVVMIDVASACGKDNSYKKGALPTPKECATIVYFILLPQTPLRE
jgi:hypothetical protein